MDLTTLPPPHAEKKESSPPVKTKNVETKYTYPYAGQRDPFVSLLGGSTGGKTQRDSQHSVENFSQLQLKGIYEDIGGPVAILSSTDGETFKLKGELIYDRRNKKLSGVSGKIKGEKVILYGPNKTSKELSLKKS